MQEVVSKLDELIEATRLASLPLEARWVDCVGIAAMLSYKPRYVMENIAFRPGFPKPMRVEGGGHPRWLASEIQQWAMAQRETGGGRRRKIDD